MIRIPEFVRSLSPYKAGNQVVKQEIDSPFDYLINLASNENPLGVSDKAKEAIIKEVQNSATYPDPLGSRLAEVLGAKFGIDHTRIISGHGSESLITHVINAFTQEGEEILTAAGTFVGIFVSTNKLGRVVKKVPLKDYAFDLDAILDAIGPKTRIIYLANPNNPTGTMFTKAEFDKFIKRVPQDIVVVLDEAYYAYSELIPDYPKAFEYDDQNLIVIRTFSKTHGLAGLRVGFAYSPSEIIQSVRKVKLAFEPSILAQEAAIAAIADDDFLARTLKENTASLNMMREKFDELGIFYPEPAANFLMLKLENQEQTFDFARMCHEKGILVRPLVAFGVPEAVRISTGTVKETEYAVGVFEKAFKSLK